MAATQLSMDSSCWATSAVTTIANDYSNSDHWTWAIQKQVSPGSLFQFGDLTPTPEETVDTPGDFVLVDGEGVVQQKTYETQAKATKAARRLASKNDEQYYVYKAVKLVGPKAEVVEEDLE